MGITAEVPFEKGEQISSFLEDHTVLEDRDYLSVQVSEDTDVLDPHVVAYLNHSCDPNTRIDTVRFRVVARRDIAPGELLTFFYPETEWEMASPFACHCGAPRCLKTIGGARHLDRETMARYEPSPHILRLMEAHR